MNKTLLTQKGIEELKERLTYLKQIKRKEITKKIKTAREFGDLSENSEYKAAKEEQEVLEKEIAEIEDKLKDVVVIDDIQLNTKCKVRIGSVVTFLDLKTNELKIYTIVGVDEANIIKNKISHVSPIGQALLNKSINDEIVIQTIVGEKHFIIKDIINN